MHLHAHIFTYICAYVNIYPAFSLSPLVYPSFSFSSSLSVFISHTHTHAHMHAHSHTQGCDAEVAGYLLEANQWHVEAAVNQV